MFFTVEGGLYLPPLMDSNKEYLRGTMNGRKSFYTSKYFGCKASSNKSLSINEILTFGKNYINIEEYLPTYNYNKFPNKEWLWNMINSIAGTKLKNMSSAMLNREKEMIIRKDLNATAILEIVSIFKASNNVSYTNKTTHFLMRTKNPSSKKKVLWNGSWWYWRK